MDGGERRAAGVGRRAVEGDDRGVLVAAVDGDELAAGGLS